MVWTHSRPSGSMLGDYHRNWEDSISHSWKSQLLQASKSQHTSTSKGQWQEIPGLCLSLSSPHLQLQGQLSMRSYQAWAPLSVCNLQPCLAILENVAHKTISVLSLIKVGQTRKSNFLKKKVWWFKLIWLSKYPLISLYHLMSLIQEKKETIDQKIHEDQGTPLTFQFKRVNNYLRIISLW